MKFSLRRAKLKHKEGRSVKMLIFYCLAVFVVIFIALSIRFYFLLKASVFDDSHQFTLVVTKNNNAQAVISFIPERMEIVVLHISGKIPPSQVGKTLGIMVNDTIEDEEYLGSNISSFLFRSIFISQKQSRLTQVDFARLALFSNTVTASNIISQQIDSPEDQGVLDGTIASLLADPTIVADKLSIQIINASDTTGLGTRLERVLTNEGANVIAVSTAHKVSTKSQIQYFANRSYTLMRLSAFLHYPLRKMEGQAISDIIIVLGEDANNSSLF